MTAAELNAIATTAAAATAAIEQITERIRFDYDAPLPPLNIRPQSQLWEPAAVHYRDLEDTK